MKTGRKHSSSRSLMEAFDKMFSRPSLRSRENEPRAAPAAALSAHPDEDEDEHCTLMPKATDPRCPNNARAPIRPAGACSASASASPWAWPPPRLLLLLLVRVAATVSFALGLAGRAQLDPQQLLALRALGLGAPRQRPLRRGRRRGRVLRRGAPFRRVTSLVLTNCSDTTSVSAAALEALAPSLRALAFSDCPRAAAAPPPEQLAAGLLSFSCTASLRRLSAVWLSRLANLTELTVANTLSPPARRPSWPSSSPHGPPHSPHHFQWQPIQLPPAPLALPQPDAPRPLRQPHRRRHSDTITHLGGITHLNLSSNVLNGQIPTHIGDLIWLTAVDLSIPPFLSEMSGLKELNLENNDFDGVVPFSARFLSRLRVFRAAGNGKLCYNRSVLSAELAVGLAPCDKYGFPVTAPPATAQSEKSTADYDDGGSDGDADGGADAGGGPSAVVLGLAIGLSCLAFVVILVVCLCKVCR
ncbi:hypothetical protein ZWY2020_005004 [Hordeum vulgare]|nr:hypothetical protein ZWY2020_005004 [Hordeum vulgare]